MGIFLFHLQSNTFQMILAVPNKQSFCSISTSSYFNSSYLFFFFHPPCFTLGRQEDTMGWSTDTYHFLLYNCNILSVVYIFSFVFMGQSYKILHSSDSSTLTFYWFMFIPFISSFKSPFFTKFPMNYSGKIVMSGFFAFILQELETFWYHMRYSFLLSDT